MFDIIIRGIPGLSKEELEELAQRFHHFAGKQRAAGHRNQSLEALLQEYLSRSRYAATARVVSGSDPTPTDIVYQKLKGTFDLPEQYRQTPPTPESKVDALKQEAMLSIQNSLQPEHNRGR